MKHASLRSKPSIIHHCRSVVYDVTQYVVIEIGLGIEITHVTNFLGLLKDTKTLAESGVVNGIKMMVIGSKYADVMSVDKVEEDPSPSGSSSSKEGEPLCSRKPHAKVQSLLNYHCSLDINTRIYWFRSSKKVFLMMLYQGTSMVKRDCPLYQ